MALTEKSEGGGGNAAGEREKGDALGRKGMAGEEPWRNGEGCGLMEEESWRKGEVRNMAGDLEESRRLEKGGR